jgi:hypothetical protein
VRGGERTGQERLVAQHESRIDDELRPRDEEPLPLTAPGGLPPVLPGSRPLQPPYCDGDRRQAGRSGALTPHRLPWSA